MLGVILQKQVKIMAAIDDLEAAVAAEDSTIDAAVVLLQGIPALIAAAGTDPARLKALRDDITSRTTSLAAAVITGTPTPSASAPAITPAAAADAAAASVAS